ncbi:MAG: glycosyltransferase family 4 protein, partial [Chloroflexota bacterium]
RLIKRKGQHHLIKAVKQISDQGVDITLDLVGSGDAEGEYRELVESLQVQDKIEFRGYISREEIPNFYAQAHVFVLPSYNEGMSVATLEAMACGLPVIVSRTPGTEELVREGENGFTFEWGDIELLTQLLLKLDSDRALARQMALESRMQAKKFSWDSSAKKFDLLFFSQNNIHPESRRVKS